MAIDEANNSINEIQEFGSNLPEFFEMVLDDDDDDGDVHTIVNDPQLLSAGPRYSHEHGSNTRQTRVGKGRTHKQRYLRGDWKGKYLEETFSLGGMLKIAEKEVLSIVNRLTTQSAEHTRGQQILSGSMKGATGDINSYSLW